MCLFNSKVDVKVSLPLSNKQIKVEFSDRWPTSQISPLMQVCNPLGNTSSPVIPTSHVESLYIFENRSLPFLAQGQDGENTRWLEFFRQYFAVKDLYMSSGIALRMVSTLQDLVEERGTITLPFLRNIFVLGLRELSEHVQEAIRQLAAAEQLFGHPVTVHPWEPLSVSGVYTIIRKLTSSP